MTPQELIERLRDQRREWLDVSEPLGRPPETVFVRLVRPAEAEMHRLRSAIVADAVGDWVDAWRGFTEAVLLGDDVGSVTPVEFAPEVWREFVRDRAALAKVAFNRLAAMVSEHLQARDAAAKN